MPPPMLQSWIYTNSPQIMPRSWLQVAITPYVTGGLKKRGYRHSTKKQAAFEVIVFFPLKVAGRNLQKTYEGEHGKTTKKSWRHVMYQPKEQ